MYREVVTPAIEHWDFRPSRTQLEAVLQHLRATGWVRTEATAHDDSLVYLHPSRVAAEIASTPEDRYLTLYLEGGPGETYPQEWPEDLLEFTAELCEDVAVIDSPGALIMPIGDFGLALPCSSCEEDLLSGARELDPDTSVTPGDYGTYPAPAQCPACGHELQYSEMALMSDDERIDEVPFFRFGLVLLAVLPRPEPLTSANPDLLLALERICGVPFRSTSIDG